MLLSAEQLLQLVEDYKASPSNGKATVLYDLIQDDNDEVMDVNADLLFSLLGSQALWDDFMERPFEAGV